MSLMIIINLMSTEPNSPFDAIASRRANLCVLLLTSSPPYDVDVAVPQHSLAPTGLAISSLSGIGDSAIFRELE
jgi:hypothetical protein